MISHLKLVQLTRKTSIVLMLSVGTLFFNMHFKFHPATMKELLTRLCIQRFSLRWTLFIGILVLSPKLSASKWEMLIPNNNKKIQPEDTKSWRQTWQQTDIKDLKSSWQSKKKKKSKAHIAGTDISMIWTVLVSLLDSTKSPSLVIPPSI